MTAIDFTPICNAIIALLAAVITAYLVPFLKQKIGEKNYEEAMYWVRIAVAAAEQKYQGSGRGAEKKAAVETFLQGKGIKLDTNELDNAIEAAVHELVREDKKS